ncbi:ATP-dependent Clp protease proteolytic subunit [Aquibium sp. A9E412]|uniref:ATP-dependent Clp protease proteolytic subunit n=1 Tax=Aquibium sp. A9E412 TaxID=2976767 RepID=UPI0025B0C8EB|nr:ATP-dependent Clp protease proteolytic subunit [Aquibium sp. A9E412]MDN2565711.1 ATP-dependent Clp protease proteolytic subunit [Aquibium sp. A9E412]
MTRSDSPFRSASARAKGVLGRYFARFDDGEVMRWAFRGLVAGAVGVLVLDFGALMDANGAGAPDSGAAPAEIARPVLPPAVEGGETGSRSIDPRDFLRGDETALSRPIRFTLQPGGVLNAEGSIDVGAAARLSDELAARGEYVETVSLNSPGGALDDAIAIARMLRERAIAVRVEDGALCASSCPLVLAGGVTRSVAPEAAVGVHQFYAGTDSGTSAAQAMADAQLTTARISRHLATMGVDPALWLHALDTPPQALYYLSAEEMRGYGLVTGSAAVAQQR